MPLPSLKNWRFSVLAYCKSILISFGAYHQKSRVQKALEKLR